LGELVSPEAKFEKVPGRREAVVRRQKLSRHRNSAWKRKSTLARELSD